MGMQKMLIPGLLVLVDNVADMGEDFPVRHPPSEMLVELVGGLTPVLEEIEMLQHDLTEPTVNTLRALMHALIGAQIVLKRIKECSNVKLFFRNTALTRQLSEATINIRACVSCLPLVPLRISGEMRQEIERLNARLGELAENMREAKSMHKDQQDLAAEVADVLRTRNTGEGGTRMGSAKVMDRLIAWLAHHLDSDVDTVWLECEAMKEEVMCLREEGKFRSESERQLGGQLEEELLQALVDLDTEDQQRPAWASGRQGDHNYAAVNKTGLETPKDFICPMCSQTSADPVTTNTGFTYCSDCVTNWLKESDSAPHCTRKTTKISSDNITVRSSISRWTEESPAGDGAKQVPNGMTLPDSVSQDPSLRQAWMEAFIHEQNIQSEELATFDRKLNLRSPPSSGSETSVNSVETYVSLLSSDNSTQILKSLEELTVLASCPEGQDQIFEAGSIPALVQLLKDRDTHVAETAAGVLEALTFANRENDGEVPLPCDREDQIRRAVAETALDRLIDLMLLGSDTARLTAAQTVINILVDDDNRAEACLHSQIVSAFFTLTNIEEQPGLVFPQEGLSLCIEGLNLLSGERGTSAPDEAALTIALLGVAASGVSQLVQESLSALRALVQSGGETVCRTLDANKAIPFLVLSIARLSSGQGREDALRILNAMSLLTGMPDAIVEHDLFGLVSIVLSEAGPDTDVLNETVKLMSTCISSVSDVSQLIQADLKALVGLVGLLSLEQTSMASKVGILASLERLCWNSLRPRVAFLDSAGIETLQGLVKPFQASEINDEVVVLMRSLATCALSRKDVCDQGGIKVLSCLLTDGSPQCRAQAAIATDCLLTNCPASSITSLDGFPYKSVAALLAPTHSLECRTAAVGILSVLTARNYVLEMRWDKQSTEFLLDTLRRESDVPIVVKWKAAETLRGVVRQDSSVCPYVAEWGLPVVIDFGLQLGVDGRGTVIQLLSIFSKGDRSCKQAVLDSGGPKILLEGLQKGEMKEESAVSLLHLVESPQSSKAVVQAGFIPSALKCIQANCGTQCSDVLTLGLVAVLDNKASALSVRECQGVETLLSVFEGSAEVGKKVAAVALTKLMKLDPESSVLLGKAEGITALFEYLACQEWEGSLQLLDGIEALGALSVASEEQSNKGLILEEQGIPQLVYISTQGFPKAQELALGVLLNLSREGPTPMGQEICETLIQEKICRHLLDIVQPESQSSVTETTIYRAICIIRNLTLIGVPARNAFLDEGAGAVKVLVDRIRYHEANASSDLVTAAVIALERFMLSSRGKMALIREGGIRVIVQVLHYRLGSGQAKSFATKMLVTMAQDSQASREVCLAIFEANVIPGLRDILELGPSPECQLQACTLLKFLMYAGPRAAVCQRIWEEQCVPKLLDLRSDATCKEAATGAVDLLKTYHKESRRQIHEADRHQKVNSRKSRISA